MLFSLRRLAAQLTIGAIIYAATLVSGTGIARPGHIPQNRWYFRLLRFSGPETNRNLAHIGAFAGIAFLVGPWGRGTVALALRYVFAGGVAIEIAQSAVRGFPRNRYALLGAASDVVLDLFGGLIGLLVSVLWRRFFWRKYDRRKNDDGA